jgi:hypothetical protein
MNKSIFKTLAVAALLVSSAAAATIVDTKLSLVIDVSSSVSTDQYNLQMDGYAAAFRSAAIQNLITNNGGGGKIAVNYVFFGSNATVASVWTLLDSAININAFANTLDTVARPFTGNTNIAAGMRSSLASFAINDVYTSSRLVMDVSGDGQHNTSNDNDVNAQRDAAFAAGVIVNGLPIIGDQSGLLAHYTERVITSNGFVLAATNFESFDTAVNQKLFRELGGVPEPSTYAMMASGLLGLVYFRRKK